MTTDSMIDNRPSTTSTPPPAVRTRPRTRWLWVVLVLSLLTNVTFHSVLTNVYVSSASGLVVLGCVAVLAARARFARTGA